MLAVLLCCGALGGLVRLASSPTVHSGRASDALPLYLSAAAVEARLDPTLQSSLATVYDQRGMEVGAATFSTLYPATAGWLLRPYADLSWEDFTRAWRWTMLFSLGSFPLAAGWLAGGDRYRRMVWGGAMGCILAYHPVASECVRLGQVNMLLAAFCATAMATTLRGPAWAGGIGLAVGGLLKLVPGALVLPLLATRRVAPVLVTGVLGLLGLGLCATVVPLDRILTGIRETLRFQGSIDPDWLVGKDPAPEWMRWLGFVRHTPLQWITLGIAGVVPALRPSAQTSVGGMALICAWLGADAAGFHVLYIPLAWPALLWVAVGRPVQTGILTGIFFALALLEPEGLGPEARMVLFGLILWLWSLGRLLWDAGQVAPGAFEQDRALKQGSTALGGLIVGLLLARAAPGEGPVAPPLPEGQTTPVGAGFISPADRVPGGKEKKILGGGVDRSADTLAKPGTIRFMHLYLRHAPDLWEQLAVRYPAREALFRARAKAAPRGQLHELSGREVRSWLQEDQRTMEQLVAEGLDPGELGVALTNALSSGLADPRLEDRIPGKP